ncbi:MAG: hypothetical protein KIT85_06525 [Pseudolabrys sp.]|nr:hypothetical protein [Pseudolabrys sp.]MCW5684034.1 hypothetical protein [Pseudolabrys sp.]
MADDHGREIGTMSPLYPSGDEGIFEISLKFQQLNAGPIARPEAGV